MAALTSRTRAICHSQRAFSTTSRRTVNLQWEKNDAEALADTLPAYPYGPTRWYKQSRSGLYGGQRIQFGNNVGEKFQTRTRREWRPNILTRKLFSRALNRPVQVRVSARVLRTIDKLGGVDEYLLGEKEMRIKELGESGWWLRWAIMQTPVIQKRFAEQRRLLGLSTEHQNPAAETIEEIDEISIAETEPVTLDNAFEVQSSADALPLKFRVGPGKHIMLTADGWRRTRPDPTRRINIAKNDIAQRKLPEYVERGLEEVEELAVQKKLSRSETNLLRKLTRKELEADLQQKVDELYHAKMEKKEAGNAQRRQERAQRKAAKKTENHHEEALEA